MTDRKRWQPSAPREQEPNLDLVAIALTPLTILLQGHSFGLGNYDTLLTFIRRINDYTFLSGDWMLTTPPVHPVLLNLIAGPCAWWGEANAFLLVQVLTRALLLCGVWRLVLALLPGALRVALATMAVTVLEPRLQLGGHYLQAGHWEPAHLGMAFAVWIIAEGIRLTSGRGHWITFTLVGGFGIFSHLFICLPVFALTFGAIAWKSSLPAKQLAISIVSALFIGSPMLIPAVQGFFSPESSPLSGSEVIAVLQFRHPHHHQPWTWPLTHYLQAIHFLAAACFVWRKLLHGDARRRLVIPAILFAYFIASCVAFTVFGALHTLPIIAYFQCFRLLSLFLLMGSIAAFATIDTLVVRSVPFLLACVLFAVGMSFVQFLGTAIMAVAMVLLARRAAGREVAPGFRVHRGLAVATALLGFAGLLAMQFSPRLQSLANGARRDHWHSDSLPDLAQRAALAKWIRGNTSPDALFAIPPQMGYFRTWEERAIVADMKNIPYRNADMKEWADRIKAAGVDDPYRKFAKPSTKDPSFDQMKSFADSYRADYFVLREKIADPRNLYPGEGYSVFRRGDFDVNILDRVIQ